MEWHNFDRNAWDKLKRYTWHIFDRFFKTKSGSVFLIFLTGVLSGQKMSSKK